MTKDTAGNRSANPEATRSSGKQSSSSTSRKQSKDDLRTDQDRARRFLDIAPAIIISLDAKGHVTLLNQAGGETLECNPSETVGKNWFDTFIPEQIRDEIRSVFGKLMAGDIESVEYYENPVVTGKGNERLISWHNTLLHDEAGQITGLLSSGQDITEQKRTEEALRRQEFLLSKAQDLGKIGTWELDIVNNVLVWTEENYRVFGVPPGTPLSYETFLNCVHPEDREYVDREWAAGMKANDYDIEHRLLVNGEVRWVREKAEIGFDDAGRPITAIGFTQDITDVKRTEQELRESRAELDEILNMSLYMICVADINEATFLKVNPAFTSVLGYDEDELVGHPFAEFIHPDDVEPTRKVVEDQLQQGKKVIGFTNRYRCKNGTCRWLEWAAHPLPERGITFSIAQDITDRRQLEDRLRQTEKMEAIGQLAGGVAHDFNNQLGGIMNYADLLLSKTHDEELRPLIEGIIRLCTRSGELTNQLLAFARKGRYQVEPVDIHKVIGDVATMLQHSVDKRITIRQHLDAAPPTTSGDHAQLESALLNLGLNARDAMSDGGELIFATDTVTLDEAHCNDSTFDISPGEYLKIKVSDSGTGMDEETRARVFEPFFTTKPQGEGTGMGLASVFGTVVNHHGAIEVESAPHRGTTMTVYLPLSHDEAKQEAAGQASQTHTAGSARILLVEDDDNMRNTTATLLRNRGYEVVTSENGAEAVEYYRKSWQQIDVVVLDMNMPEMNGRDAFVAMSEISPDIKAILATGFSLDSAVQKILDGGALSHIQKPYRINDLALKIEQALNAPSSTTTLRGQA